MKTNIIYIFLSIIILISCSSPSKTDLLIGDWNLVKTIDLKSGSDVVSLGMSVRSSSGGKLKQWSLKVTYNGLK